MSNDPDEYTRTAKCIFDLRAENRALLDRAERAEGNIAVYRDESVRLLADNARLRRAIERKDKALHHIIDMCPDASIRSRAVRDLCVIAAAYTGTDTTEVTK